MRAPGHRWLLLLGSLGGLSACMPDVVTHEDVEVPQALEEIDFADDGNGSLAAIHGRKGTWGTFRDECPGGLVKPPVGTSLSPEKGGVNGSFGYYRGTAEGLHARQLDGMDADGRCWGAFVYFDLNNDQGPSPRDYDASAYTGIFFAAKGQTSNDNVLRVELTQAEIVSMNRGGECGPMGGCDDNYGDVITLGPEWRGYTIHFSELAQGGWGLQTPFNPARLRSVQFVGSSGGKAVDFDISVDQVGFIKREP